RRMSALRPPWLGRENWTRHTPITNKRCGWNLTTPSITPVMLICWSNWARTTRRRRSAKQQSVWRPSLRRPITAMATFWHSTEYHSGYAYLLEQLGQDDQAAAECEAAVRLAPKSAQAHHSYGAFLEKHGKLDEATAQYREAVRADPGLVDAQIDLGTALLEKGDLSEAKAHLQAATKLDPKLAQPHNYLGKIFMREGNTSSAIAQFEEALRLHPDFPEAEENLRMAKASDGGSLTLSPK